MGSPIVQHLIFDRWASRRSSGIGQHVEHRGWRRVPRNGRLGHQDILLRTLAMPREAGAQSL